MKKDRPRGPAPGQVRRPAARSAGAVSRRTLLWLILIAVASAAFRFAPTPAPYLELDSAIYLRAAADYHRALVDGAWLTNPLRQEHYTAIEYWPPLFPMLAGLVGNAWTVAAAAGWLTLFPIFFLARRLWDDDGTALAAAALVGLNPFLAWYARVPRTEGLFVLLDACALALVLVPWKRPWGPMLGGAFLGLAFATRFDAILILAATLVAVLVLRGRKAAALTFLGFFLAALPYLHFLAVLNGGIPTLITPQKALYDALEGAWTGAYGRNMFEFTIQFGPPGLTRVNPADPAVRELLAAKVPGLVLEGLERIPGSLASASWNWMLLVVPVGLALMDFRDPRIRALLWLLLPVPALAVLTSWDPNPRYFAFTLLPLGLLAARGLTLLATAPAPGPQARWAIFGLIAPMQIAAAWIVPSARHFDQRGPVENCFVDLVPGARDLHMAIVALGFGLAGMVLWKRSRLAAGLAGTAVALAVVGGEAGAALQQAEGLYRMVIPLSLILLALMPLVAFPTLPRDLWGPRMRTWLLAAMGVVAVQNALVLSAWDLAHTRLVHSPPLAAILAGKPPGTRVLAYQQVDALRSGVQWVPLRLSRGLSSVLEEEHPDYVLLTLPETGSTQGAVVAVPALEATGRVRLEAVVPGEGSVAGCPREWRLYRVVSPASPGGAGR